VTVRKNILVDAREWTFGRMTGIGRMLAGCVAALAESHLSLEITLAVSDESAIPVRLKERVGITFIKIPWTFLQSERALSDLTRKRCGAFISPYPKLPLFGVHCPCAHTIHDVLDLTDPLYRTRLRTFFDKYRLKRALGRADLSWYDSLWSMKETKALLGDKGRNPKVRHLGVADRFSNAPQELDSAILERYGLKAKTYVLILGNGLPHKNLGILLDIADRIPLKLLFVGVSEHNQSYWEKQYPTQQAMWIERVTDEGMPSLLRQAFCLFQPSLAEGYGYPPLEAMACGTPAVISNIPVLIETTGGHALSCDPHNGKSWIEAYQRIENETEYYWQVQKGLQWVERLKGQRGWEKHISDIEELLRGS
jgi:glycosyltransferase involved in cell wall biosynthesis